MMRDRTARPKKPSQPASTFHTPPQATAPGDTSAVLRAAGILQLQRTHGNQAVRRLLQRQPAGVHQPVAPARPRRKAEFGLAGNARSTSFVDKAHTYINDVANKDVLLADMAVRLGDFMADELKTTGVPPIPVVVTPIGTMGVFRKKKWVLEADPKRLTDNATTTKTGQLTKDEAAEIVDTIYHEARHGEQWFNMAQMKAGEGWDAAKIEKDMGIAKSAADLAVATPLPELTREFRETLNKLDGGASTGGLEDIYGQINGMFASVYGSNRYYRDLILEMLQDAGRKALAATTDAVTVANLADTITKLKPVLKSLKKTLLPKIDTELTRVKAIATKTANDTTMLKHLEALKTAVEEVIAAWKAGKTEAHIKKMKPFADTIHATIHAAYLDLPEEADAWAVAGRAKAKYNAK